MIIQLLISIAFLSLIQTVFSKRSADTLQCYFGTSKASVQSNVGNSYRIRKHGLAFVQSRAARYLNSKSEQVYSTVSSTGTTKRNLFSFNLNDVMTKDSKQKDEKDNSKLEDEINEIVEDKGSSLNGDIFGLSSWAKGLVSTKELSRAKSTDERNWFDTDIKTPKEDEPKSENSKSSDFPLASLINVEALLMASGKLPADSEADPGTAWLADMLSQSASKGATPTSPETSNIIENVNDDAYDIAKGPRSELSLSTEFVLNQVTQKLESFLNDATASFSQEGLQSLILTAARSLSVDQNADVLKSTFDNIVATAENIAREQGVDVSEAAAQARATSKVTTEFIRVANGVLLSGYVSGDDMSINIDENKNLAKEMKISLDTTSDAKPLFHRFESVQSISSADFRRVSKQGAVNAQLAGAIYQDMIPSVPILGHSMVVKGTSADVKWMVTDSIGDNSDFEPTSHQETGVPTIIRTITIRGFDASDEDVDRERLVTEICNAGKVPLTDDLPGLQVHRGLLAIAKEIYEDIKPFIDLAGPTHKIVLNGHSIGGALANLILMLMTVERGSIFVQEKINRVYTFGSPPIAKTDPKIGESNDSSGMYDCSVLEALGLPSDIVFGFVEPWVSNYLDITEALHIAYCILTSSFLHANYSNIEFNDYDRIP